MTTRLSVLRTLPYWWWIATVISAATFVTLIVTAHNWKVLHGLLLVSKSILPAAKVLLDSIANLPVLFSLSGAIAIILFTWLSSVNLLLLWKHGKSLNASGSTGLLLSLVGVGCGACGGTIVLSILSVFGLGGAITFLPFHGQEFALLGILALLYSNWFLLGRIARPGVCPV